MKIYRVIFTKKSLPLEQRGTEVVARDEITAISAAQFELKRAAGFNVSWIDRMPAQYGLHFLHGFNWDIVVKEISS